MVQLRKFAIAQGADWDALCEASGVRRRLYVGMGTYPDADVLALVAGASKALGIPASQVLEAFGRFLAPGLIDTYGAFLQSEWRTMDLLENVEGTMHATVRMRQREAAPPALEATRVGPGQVHIDYRSERRLCHLARGLIEGVAEHFDEAVLIEEPECMLRGDERCLFDVRLR